MITLQGSKHQWAFSEKDKIGSGGNSVVYMADREGASDQLYALKLFTDTANSDKKRVRFSREITIVQSLLGTPGCSELIDHGINGERPFYIMPYYAGGDLFRRFIKHPQNPVDVASILNIFARVTEILARLHAEPRKLAVRDLKPQNILISVDGSPVICDFGLALWSDTPDEDRLTTQRAVGSAGYRPPEWDTAYPPSDQTAGDIWSLGRTLWALAASKTPPSNYESLGTTGLHLKNWIEDSHVATAVQGLVNQCTAIKPSERPPANEVLKSTLDVIGYCSARNNNVSNSSLDERLATLSLRLPGSDVVADALQKKAELDARHIEIKNSQDMLIGKLREFLPKLSSAIKENTGKFAVFGNELRKTEASWVADAYIVFFPASSLIETGLAKEVTYTFGLGLNSNGDFAWWEISQIYGHSSEHSHLNPRSLATLSAQKCGQIESILAQHFIPEIDRMLIRTSDHIEPSAVATKNENPAATGTADFDYSNNDGRFKIGTLPWTFETAWSKSSETEIHCYRETPDIAAMAIAKGATEISEISDASLYDFTSNVRSPQTGEIVIWKSRSGFYAAAKISLIWDDKRGNSRDRLKFDFVILTDRTANFSGTISLKT